jgi:predicted DNA binding CopG/RHH family protein
MTRTLRMKKDSFCSGAAKNIACWLFVIAADGMQQSVYFPQGGRRKKNMKITKGKMKKEYDFSCGIQNPYAKTARSQITIRINNDTITYFKALAVKTGIPYQNLINSCLADYVKERKEPVTIWDAPDS